MSKTRPPLRLPAAVAVLAVALAGSAIGAQDGAIELSFDDLIQRAPSIVLATVTSRRAEWESYGTSKLIITKVSLQVEQTLKGSAPRELTIEVLGGTIGEETLHVSHVPEFAVGDRDVLFLNNAPHSVSPLVGSDQGRFRVINESASGTARVVTRGYAPLVAVADIGSERERAVSSLSSALSVTEFVTQVRDRARQLERRR